MEAMQRRIGEKVSATSLLDPKCAHRRYSSPNPPGLVPKTSIPQHPMISHHFRSENGHEATKLGIVQPIPTRFTICFTGLCSRGSSRTPGRAPRATCGHGGRRPRSVSWSQGEDQGAAGRDHGWPGHGDQKDGKKRWRAGFTMVHMGWNPQKIGIERTKKKIRGLSHPEFGEYRLINGRWVPASIHCHKWTCNADTRPRKHHFLVQGSLGRTALLDRLESQLKKGPSFTTRLLFAFNVSDDRKVQRAIDQEFTDWRKTTAGAQAVTWIYWRCFLFFSGLVSAPLGGSTYITVLVTGDMSFNI